MTCAKKKLQLTRQTIKTLNVKANVRTGYGKDAAQSLDGPTATGNRDTPSGVSRPPASSSGGGDTLLAD